MLKADEKSLQVSKKLNMHISDVWLFNVLIMKTDFEDKINSLYSKSFPRLRGWYLAQFKKRCVSPGVLNMHIIKTTYCSIFQLVLYADCLPWEFPLLSDWNKGNP